MEYDSDPGDSQRTIADGLSPTQIRRLSLPAISLEAHFKSMLVVRLAYFYRCSCEESGQTHGHLSVETKKAALHYSQAVAISYPWGEFDRQKRIIGHWRGQPDKKASITLGAEWSIPSLKERLAQLTAQHGACWLDQFCVSQNAEKIRKTLAAIPSIYKTYPVIALLPGSLCKCLGQALDDYQAAEFMASKEMVVSDDTRALLSSKNLILTDAVLGRPCLNSNRLSSWTTRLWPLLEFFYSRSFSVLYVDQTTAPCFLKSDMSKDITKLNSYCRNMYERIVKTYGCSHDEAIEMLEVQTDEFWMSSIDMIYSGVSSNDMWTTWASIFLGRTPLDAPASGDELSKLCMSADSLSISARSTTKEIDYILSVWVAWKQYVIPTDWHDRTANDLLRDAFSQLYSYSGWFIPSRCPWGLLGGDFRTASWASNSPGESMQIRDSIDIYGQFAWLETLLVSDIGRIPLELISHSHKSLARDNQCFSVDTAGFNMFTPTVTAILRFLRCAQHWSPTTQSRIRERGIIYPAHNYVAMLRSTSPSQQVIALRWLIWKRQSHVGHLEVLSTLESVSSSISSEVLGDALFEIVCDAICVDSKLLRDNNVELIFSHWHGDRLNRDTQERMPCSAPCVGLINRLLLDTWRILAADDIFPTISLRTSPGVPCYEAVKVPSSSTPEYAIIGVWVPLHLDIKVDEVGAMMVDDRDNPDAVVI